MNLIKRVLREKYDYHAPALHIDAGRGYPLCGKGNSGKLAWQDAGEGQPTCRRCINRIGSVKRRGYLYVYAPDHPLADFRDRVALHRKVWFDAHGSIPPGKVIHHINGDITDNRLENLACLTIKEHNMAHFHETLPKLRQYWGNDSLEKWRTTHDPWNKGATRFVELECIECHTIFTRRECIWRRYQQKKGYAPCCSHQCRTIHARHKRLRTKHR